MYRIQQQKGATHVLGNCTIAIVCLPRVWAYAVVFFTTVCVAAFMATFQLPNKNYTGTIFFVQPQIAGHIWSLLKAGFLHRYGHPMD